MPPMRGRYWMRSRAVALAMPKAKVALTLDAELLDRVDHLVRPAALPQS